MLCGIGVTSDTYLSSPVQEASSTAILLHHMQTLTAEVSNAASGLELLRNQILTSGALFQVGRISSDVRAISTTVATIQVVVRLLAVERSVTSRDASKCLWVLYVGICQ